MIILLLTLIQALNTYLNVMNPLSPDSLNLFAGGEIVKFFAILNRETLFLNCWIFYPHSS